MLEMESVRAREKYGPRGRERERGRDSVPFWIGGWYPISCLSLLKPGEYKNEKGGRGDREGGRALFPHFLLLRYLPLSLNDAWRWCEGQSRCHRPYWQYQRKDKPPT